MTFPSPEGATPAMAQWFALKAEHPDALLFFRMGDFYELFFNDAEAAAAALDISLTARGTHGGEPIAMCGVPVHAAQAYLARLIRRGFRVSVAEQTEQPRKGRPASKGPLRREVVRLITPGTLTEDELLEAGRQNLLAAIACPTGRDAGDPGLAWIDISTGLFETAAVPARDLNDLLGRLDPAEILCADNVELGDFAGRRTPIVPPASADAARQRMAEAFGVASPDAFGTFSDAEAMAAAAAIDYIRRSQAGQLPRLSHPRPSDSSDILGLDPATRASLDLLRTRDGETEHTLFAAVSRTVTAAGSRMLADWIAAPLTDPERIARRQAGWGWLLDKPGIRDDLRACLRAAPDMARALGRLSLGRGQPRDAVAIRLGLGVAREIGAILNRHDTLPPIMEQAARHLDRAHDLQDLLARALSENPPARMDDGGIIASGYDAELDAQRELRDGSRRIIAAMQQEYAEEFGISNLKIRHHAQLGYVIEVPAAASARLRGREDLIMRQGTASASRFSTERLVSLDQQIAQAAENAGLRERHLFTQVVARILDETALPDMAAALSCIDIAQSCAVLAGGGMWCCPAVGMDTSFVIRAGRHPVVEAALPRNARFTPNDCDLEPDHRVMLLTGPNMAGKSTFLRQTALAVILAQAGLPVAAQSMRIGVVDRLFSRVGASDDLARGRSTFMVEMTETAAILNQAGPRSLVVVDEIGRGTSTLDGLAIAWAVLETLHSTLRCRAIFATHFHELAELADSMPRLSPHTMSVREWKGQVIFQHEVVPGSARRSWGVHVARLAGVPEPVVRRAGRLLSMLEKERGRQAPPLPLFEQAATDEPDAPAAPALPPAAMALVTELDPDALSPRTALEMLYKLKKLLKP
ncbi:DNA mismatch repair protein MutS [Komagataeibacter swingsii]|uniref:DNA mismatch repair protein MutS n=1 Tax=Komagataeibacter swingsii TaxID=215220 RepID=A0A2V4SCN3_9PROT|nr:DNA mismatch repair protein MutS [Komagataeibacter swingsii]PYD69698.1 DNA mismatch repair protein MutS [Komagataeibacter swingsii]GBQ55056.1 DNA mismatch repair protein MutS [Komagataeibacter swingsii DSM 16373]